MHLFLFDIDGTLLLTGGAGLTAVNRTFKEVCGIDPELKFIEASGKTDPLILFELFAQVMRRRPQNGELERFREVYESSMAEELPRASHFRVLAGAAEFVELLSKRSDVMLGLATGNFEKTAWQKLKRAGLEGYFKFGGFGSDSPIRRELTRIGLERGIKHIGGGIKINGVYVVGDTIHDIDCGRFIGAKTVAVASGFVSAEELKAAQPDFFFPSLVEAEKALTTILCG
ncbi:MAG: HAD hydrolase-like protein [Deltaproteobacteria bacterium]|nr:HAD hydrolase-like protein [Deltaproteobacteria bacterium]